ncbi:unnamed protein product [Clavelina lepadiformis]|uniref:Uncharacterized protein n=1 Tax=Clavelina lepadiformis TaxID=159417 RepID=A0ABP0GKK9_CLALP
MATYEMIDATISRSLVLAHSTTFDDCGQCMAGNGLGLGCTLYDGITTELNKRSLVKSWTLQFCLISVSYVQTLMVGLNGATLDDGTPRILVNESVRSAKIKQRSSSSSAYRDQLLCSDMSGRSWRKNSSILS